MCLNIGNEGPNMNDIQIQKFGGIHISDISPSVNHWPSHINAQRLWPEPPDPQSHFLVVNIPSHLGYIIMTWTDDNGGKHQAALGFMQGMGFGSAGVDSVELLPCSKNPAIQATQFDIQWDDNWYFCYWSFLEGIFFFCASNFFIWAFSRASRSLALV